MIFSPFHLHLVPEKDFCRPLYTIRFQEEEKLQSLKQQDVENKKKKIFIGFLFISFHSF